MIRILIIPSPAGQERASKKRALTTLRPTTCISAKDGLALWDKYRWWDRVSAALQQSLQVIGIMGIKFYQTSLCGKILMNGNF